jgi:hypothetical protein
MRPPTQMAKKSETITLLVKIANRIAARGGITERNPYIHLPPIVLNYKKITHKRRPAFFKAISLILIH